MNLYEVLIQRGEKVEVAPGRYQQTREPVTQLVLAEESGLTAENTLVFSNDMKPLNDYSGEKSGTAVAAFASGQWLSFRCAERGVSPTAQRKLRNNDGVWS